MPAIAIIGASSDRNKFGNKAVRAYQQKGWTVFPIHPKEVKIEGVPSFSSILNIPAGSLERVSLYVPPPVGLPLLTQIAQRQPAEVWLNPGTSSPAMLAEAQRLGLHVIEGCSIVDVGVDPHELP